MYSCLTHTCMTYTGPGLRPRFGHTGTAQRGQQRGSSGQLPLTIRVPSELLPLLDYAYEYTLYICVLM